jgi:hypothetical protein
MRCQKAAATVARFVPLAENSGGFEHLRRALFREKGARSMVVLTE